MSQAATKIVCLGDSITWGFPHGHYFSWVRMLQDELGIPVINQGLNGDDTGNMLHRFRHSVLDYEPSHVIVMGGLNDVFMRIPYPVIVNNLQAIAEKAAANGIKTVFGTPTAVDYEEYERMIWRIRDWIYEYAENHGLPVIPFHQAFLNDDRSVKSQYLLADGGHPTEEGFERLYRMIDLSIFS